jgi:hypothetical protein
VAKFIPSQTTVGVWLGRLVLAVVLLAFGYAVAYVVNHWQPEDLTPYVQKNSVTKTDLSRLQQQVEGVRQSIELLQRAVPAQPVAPVANGLEARVAALEGLQGTVGNLSQVFLGQQLVILDSAYRQGGDLVPGIEHVKNFALTEAKNTAVADALNGLQEVTPLSGPVTAAELVLTAEALYDMEPLLPGTSGELNWWQQVVASFKRWVKVTELDNPQDPDLAWDLAVNHVRFSIAHGDAQGALNILNQAPFTGVEAVEPFRQGLTQHLLQQQALMNVQKAFIESYKP